MCRRIRRQQHQEQQHNRTVPFEQDAQLSGLGFRVEIADEQFDGFAPFEQIGQGPSVAPHVVGRQLDEYRLSESFDVPPPIERLDGLARLEEVLHGDEGDVRLGPRLLDADHAAETREHFGQLLLRDLFASGGEELNVAMAAAAVGLARRRRRSQLLLLHDEDLAADLLVVEGFDGFFRFRFVRHDDEGEGTDDVDVGNLAVNLEHLAEIFSIRSRAQIAHVELGRHRLRLGLRRRLGAFRVVGDEDLDGGGGGLLRRGALVLGGRVRFHFDLERGGEISAKCLSAMQFQKF